MALGLCLITTVVAIWLLTGQVARPSSHDRYARPVDPRPSSRPQTATPVAPPPHVVAVVALARTLRTELDPVEVDRVLSRATAHGLPVEVLQDWAGRFGVARTVTAVDAGLALRSMRRHLAGETTPDWDALAIFADLTRANDRLQEIADSPDDPDWEENATTGGFEVIDLRQFGRLPQISDPADLSTWTDGRAAG